jgi:transcriptional regulator with XRE-family HTH domain
MGLRQLRQNAVMTQKELADKSGVSNKTIVSIEAGAWPRQSTIRKLAAALDLTPRELARRLREP